MREITKDRMYKMEWEFTQEEFTKGEISITGTLTYTIKDLEKLKSQFENVLVDDLNHHIGYILNNDIHNTLQFTSGFDLIAKRPLIINRIELETRQKLAELGIDLIDIHIVDVWFYGVEEQEQEPVKG